MLKQLLAAEGRNPGAGLQRQKQVEVEMRKIERQIQELQAKHNQVQHEYSCHALLTMGLHGPISDKVNDALTGGMESFRASLTPPEGYNPAEDVAYSETDDYGDVAGLDEAVDTTLDWISELVEAGKMHEAVTAMVSLTVQLSQCDEAVKSAVAPHQPGSDWDEVRDEVAGAWENYIAEGETGTTEFKDMMLQICSLSAWTELFGTLLGAPFDSIVPLLEA